jgi:Kelch motif/Galactose oxidase, central domain
VKAFALAFLVLPLAGAAGTGGITPVAPMNVARAVHTATTLADGRVLVVGGCTTNGCELDATEGTVAELYDPGSRRFQRSGRLHEWRDDHSATLLRDGRVLVAGGWSVGGVLASSELFDPHTETFAVGPSMSSRRAGATATLLRDGRVLVAGGFVDNRPTVSLADVFVPARNRFQPVTPMTVPRGAHAAARLADGRVLVIGGLSRGRVVATSELFDPRTNRFARGPAMRLPRYKAAAVTMRDGRVLVVGGSADVEGRRIYRSTEIYEPKRNRFVPGPQMRRARYKLRDAVVLLPGGDVLVAGGAPVPELWRRSSGRFAAVAGTLGRTRLFATASGLGSGEVLVIGGYDLRISPTAQAWLYR